MIHASVSASPPNETALRMASSKLVDSRNAMSAGGTVPWQDTSNLAFAPPGSREEHSCRSRLSFHAFRMIVRDFRASCRFSEHILESIESVTDC